MTRVPTGSIDSGHLLLVGAGPGLGLAIARRFATGGYRVTLVARSADRLGELAQSLDDTGAEINTVEADASSPEDLRARIGELYGIEYPINRIDEPLRWNVVVQLPSLRLAA